MNRINRISAMLVQLQSRPVVKATQMAERFGVSARTIYRDIRTLTEAGVPICGDAGIGYSLVEGYRLPPLMFTKEEAIAFITAEKFIEQLTDSQNSFYFHQGMDKVRAVMRNVDKNSLAEIGNIITVYKSRNAPHEKLPNLLQTILNSVNDKFILHICYTNVGNEESKRHVEAVGVAYSHPYWYLYAWCHLRNEHRSFRLDRIDSIIITEKTHTKEHPSLESLVGHDDVNCLTEVIIRTSKEVATYTADVCRYMGLVKQHDLPNGQVEQKFMVYSIEPMARWVLSNGDTTTVVKPVELKSRIKQIIKNIRL